MAVSSFLVSRMEVFVNGDVAPAQQAASCNAIIGLLLHRTITIQQVVSTLGEYLTTSNDTMRARGILLLAELLAGLAATPLEDTTVHSLATFYTACLADWHSLRGSLVGSLALLRRVPNVGAMVAEAARDMARLGVENLHIQALAQQDRILCLEFLECLLDKHSAAVAPLGGDLLYAVCAAIEEEKDPRCLLLAFRIVELLAGVFPESDGPLADYAEELFDIVSRYFPISFTPLPGHGGLTREDLATGLKRVFACTHLFAPVCIPLLLEKLSSSLQKAKLDSLSYLGHCTIAYGAGAVSEHVGAIWGALKTELLPLSVPASATLAEPKDFDIVQEALSCLTKWVEAFETFQGENNVSQMPFLKLTKTREPGEALRLVLEDECVEDLFACVEMDALGGVYVCDSLPKRNEENSVASPGTSSVANERAKLRAKATGQVLAAAARASPSSCCSIFSQVLTRLVALKGIVPEKDCFRSLKLFEAKERESLSSPDENTFQLENSCTSPKEHSSLEEEDDSGLDKKISETPVGLEVVNMILLAASDVAKKCATSLIGQGSLCEFAPELSERWLDLLGGLAPHLIAAFCQAISSNVKELSKLGVAGLEALASFPGSLSPLSDNQLRDVFFVFKDILSANSQSNNLWDESLTALVSISNKEEQFEARGRDVGILTLIIPHLLEAVQEEKSGTLLQRQLGALAMIAGPRPVALERVLEGLRRGINADFLRACADDERVELVGKVVAVLRCLSKDLLPLCEGRDSDRAVAAKIAMDILWFLPSAGLHVDEEMLRWSMEAIRIAVQKSETAAQKEIIQKGMELLHELAHNLQPESSALGWNLIGAHTTKARAKRKEWLVALVASVVVSLRRLTEVPKKQELVQELVLAAMGGFPLVTEAAAQAVASLLNKWTAESGEEGPPFALEDAVRVVLDEGWLVEVKDENPNLQGLAKGVGGEAMVHQMVCRVRGLAWAGKGLAMRGHSRIADVAGVLLRLLLSGTNKTPQESEYTTAMAAAEGLGIIVKDSEVCLNKAHHAVIRPLFKQQFFNSMLSPLTEAMRAAVDSSARSLWLMSELDRVWLYRGFAHLVSGTPHGALLTAGERVFPLLLEGLSSLCNEPSDSDLLLITLLALSSFLVDIHHGRSIVSEHVSSLVNRLLVLIQYRYSLVIRQTSLQCLAAIVGLPYARVFPLRTRVLQAMSAAQDDPKRVVRKEAVRCRRVWGLTQHAHGYKDVMASTISALHLVISRRGKYCHCISSPCDPYCKQCLQWSTGLPSPAARHPCILDNVRASIETCSVHFLTNFC